MQLLERSLQHCRMLLTLGIIGRASHQHTDPAHPHARLCSRHKRPSNRCAAEKPDEIAPLHVPSVRTTPYCNALAFCDPQCPLWVKSRHVRRKTASLCPLKRHQMYKWDVRLGPEADIFA